MDYIEMIRKLARSSYWQSIFTASKEVGSLRIFDNDGNYSGLQSTFLYWLRVYDLLYSELSSKEWKYLDEQVIENDIRCDAFLYWRGTMRENALLKNKQEQKVNNLKFSKPGKVSSFDIDLGN
jgi:hypothetical protein